jgi:hypothetical protein
VFAILDFIKRQELPKVFLKNKVHFLEEATFPTTFISQQKSTE